MKLTEKERKALRAIQKSERFTRKTRYIYVIICVLLLGFIFYIYSFLSSQEAKYSEDIELLALFYSTTLPKFYIFVTAVGVAIGATIRNFIPNPTRILLIGLAQRLEQEAEGQESD